MIDFNWMFPIIQVMAMRAPDERFHDTRDILSLLNRFRRYKATDPRDKIFALFGLTSTNLEGSGMHPDYNSDVTDCYKRTALSILSSYGNLDLFSTPRAQIGLSQNLLSWVPDWTGDKYPKVSLIGLSDPEKENIPKFDSTKGSIISQSLHNLGNVLHLSGYTVDQIQLVGDVFTTYNPNFEDYHNATDSFRIWVNYMSNTLGSQVDALDVFLQWEKIALANEHQKYPTGEDPLHVYCSTLCAGVFPEGPQDAFEKFTKWRTALRGPRALNKVKLNKIRGLYKVASPIASQVFSDIKGFDRTFVAIAGASCSRRLARSSKGYLALVPPQSCVGDSIVLLRGGRLPYVCRPQNAEWELIGDSYVHGMMYGELWEEAKCSNFRFR